MKGANVVYQALKSECQYLISQGIDTFESDEYIRKLNSMESSIDVHHKCGKLNDKQAYYLLNMLSSTSMGQVG